MTPLQMQAYFEVEIAKIDGLEKPLSEDVFYFINQAISKFAKTRYSGINFKREGFEQSQKRMDDLRTLVTTTRLVPTIPSTTPPMGIMYAKPNSYYVAFPNNYMFTLSEEVTISFTGLDDTVKSIRTGITECTLDTYTFKVDDPMESHVLHMEYARPLRLEEGINVWLVTDGNYTIQYYYLTYLKTPNTVFVNGITSSSCDLPEHTHQEIVKLAVDMYLENSYDQRIKTYQGQVNTME